MSRRPPPPSHVGQAPHTSLVSSFPKCCDLALEQVSRVVSATAALHAQSRSRSHNHELQAILDRDLFCLNDRKACRLSQIQSFVLLRKIATFFADEEAKPWNDEASKNAYRYALFETIFLGREGESILHAARIQVLFKLASYSLQHPSLTLFIPLAQWLRKMIGRSGHPEELISMIVDHFIQPDPALRLYDFLLPISRTAPEFGYILVALAPRENCVGFAMASVVSACLHGLHEEFLVMMEDFPDKLAVPFAKHSFSCLAKYGMQRDESEEGEEERLDSKEMEVDEETEENDDCMKDHEEDDPEEGEVPIDSLEQRLSRLLTAIVNGWNVRGVTLEIDGDILSKMTSTDRRRNLVEAINSQKGKKVSLKI